MPAKVSSRYAKAAEAAGDPVVLRVIEGEGHDAFLSPSTESWRVSRELVLAEDPLAPSTSD